MPLLSGNEPGIEVIGEVATAEQALDACQDLRPDVVLADLGLSADDTLARRHNRADGVTGLLLSLDSGLAVVGLCEIGDEKLVASAMRAGARGCVNMGADGPELLRAVAAAGRGQAILSGLVLQQLHRGLQEDETGPVLTDRERQVRSMMAGRRHRTPKTMLNEPQPTPGPGQRSIRAGPAAIAARRDARPASRGARRAGPPARHASPPAVPGPHVARCAES